MSVRPGESSFNEPSDRTPHASVYWSAAQKFANALVGSRPQGAAEAVAREAYFRVLGTAPLIERRPVYDIGDLMRRKRFQAGLTDARMASYSNAVDFQLAWNRARPLMLRRGDRWVNYDDDPDFVEWISGFHWKWRLGFENRYVHWNPAPASAPRLSIAQLAPMPEEILRVYFRSRKWKPLLSGEGRLPPVRAHLVALTCQHLLALHSARGALFGQRHVVRLLRLLHKMRGQIDLPQEPVRCFDSVVLAPLVVESSALEVWLKRVVPGARVVLESVASAMTKPETAWSRLQALLPDRFCVQQACGRCGTENGSRLQAVGAQLPPFGPRCSCQLGWRCSRAPEIQRRLEVWAFDRALQPWAETPFPFMDFFREGGELRCFS